MTVPEVSISTAFLCSPKFSPLFLSQRKSIIFHLETHWKKRNEKSLLSFCASNCKFSRFACTIIASASSGGVSIHVLLAYTFLHVQYVVFCKQGWKELIFSSSAGQNVNNFYFIHEAKICFCLKISVAQKKIKNKTNTYITLLEIWNQVIHVAFPL